MVRSRTECLHFCGPLERHARTSTVFGETVTCYLPRGCLDPLPLVRKIYVPFAAQCHQRSEHRVHIRRTPILSNDFRLWICFLRLFQAVTRTHVVRCGHKIGVIDELRGDILTRFQSECGRKCLRVVFARKCVNKIFFQAKLVRGGPILGSTVG